MNPFHFRYACHGEDPQKWGFVDGVLKNTKGVACLSFRGTISQTGCRRDDDSFRWQFVDKTLSPQAHPDVCLDRLTGGEPMLQPCIPEMESQKWDWLDKVKK